MRARNGLGAVSTAAMAFAMATTVHAQTPAASDDAARTTTPTDQTIDSSREPESRADENDASQVKEKDAEIARLKAALSARQAPVMNAEPTPEVEPPPATIPILSPRPPTTEPASNSAALPATATQATSAPDLFAPDATESNLPTTGIPSSQNPADEEDRLGHVFVTGPQAAQVLIAPSLGATTYAIGPSQIESTPGGDNASFQQVLLRAPGVVLDSFGQEHVRGEHGNLTYRVNGVILPEPLNGFGQELDTHLIDTVSLVDGSLPAQYGFRTAGIVDVTTKSGDTLKSNEISLYGGSYDTLEPSFEVGGVLGKWDYFVTGSYKHDSFGIESPTGSIRPVHDDTDQQRLFTYASYHIDDTSRLSFLVNASYADFEIPDTPRLPQAFTLNGAPSLDSARVDENQNEQEYYGVVSYQRSFDKLSLQASGFSRYGQIHFNPDLDGDLVFQGDAAEVLNTFLTNGAQIDASYIVNDDHTLRAGFLGDYTNEVLDTNSAVFPVDPITGFESSSTPTYISDHSGNYATTAGIYVQDEWRLNRALTLNYGVRFDLFAANFDEENQVSPRANLVWKVDPATTAHVGYSRYFVPPPIQNVTDATINRFNGTTNQAANFANDAPRVERSDYYDLGVSRQVNDALQISVDGFYKYAHNLVDLGQFGQAVILSPYNYRVGTVYGSEVSANYKMGGLSTFANFAYVATAARDIDTQQYLFDPDELAYIRNHNIKLDHESEFTGSAGATYQWPNDRVYVDVLYGSGLRAGFANTNHEPQYYPLNLGYEHVFRLDAGGRNSVRLRAEVTNVFDQNYQIRSGTGLGVNASQYGERRAFFLGLAYDF